MTKLHITQDEHGFWMLCLERSGEMQLLACHFTRPDHLIHDARKEVEEGAYPDATIVIDAPDPAKALPESVEEWPREYQVPEPARAKG